MRVSWIVAAVVVLAVAAGCGRNSPSQERAAAGGSAATPTARAHPTADDESSEETGGDPCRLLQPAEVEAVLGQKLAAPPFRYDMSHEEYGRESSTCRYQAADFRFVDVDVIFSGGARVFKMGSFVGGLLKQAPGGLNKHLKLSDGSEVAGEWDEAQTRTCCTFIALRGDQMVTVDVSSTPATLAQAADLTDKALKRIESPLAIDGLAGIEAAQQLNAKRPTKVDVCSLVTRADVEGLFGPLEAPPQAGSDRCTYRVRGSSYPEILTLAIDWSYGYRTFREDAGMEKGVMGALLGGTATAEQPSASNGPWELSRTGLHFDAVKRDVRFTVDLRTATEAHARQLVAAAIGKVRWP
jgi:hypothetical protein